jgi:hypothetical protein
MRRVEVSCGGDTAGGWTCSVRILQGDRQVSAHEVRVTKGDLERLAPGSADPSDLVERFFAFLLEREPPGSILRTFDLPLIGRYFPEYEAEITAR